MRERDYIQQESGEADVLPIREELKMQNVDV